jgi:hypothetical protein
VAGQTTRVPPPRAFAKSQTHPPTCQLFFLGFFLVHCGAFLGKGSSKTPYKYICKKSISKSFQSQSKQILVFVFVVSRFRVFLGNKSSKTQQTVLQANRVETNYKQIDKKTNVLRFVSSRFRAFLSEGSSKTPETNHTQESDSGPFLASGPPTHHGGHRILFCLPRGAEGEKKCDVTYLPFVEIFLRSFGLILGSIF